MAQDTNPPAYPPGWEKTLQNGRKLFDLQREPTLFIYIKTREGEFRKEKSMKKFTKLLGIVLIIALVMSMGTAAFAVDDGSIKVTNATKGQTYEAFLVFPASVTNPDDLSDGVTYTATAAQVAVSGFDTYFDKIANDAGGYTISKKSTAQDNDVINWVKTNIESLKQGSAIPGTVADDDTVTFANLAYGYYYITSSLGTLVTIDTAGKNIEVVDKNESTPTGPDKEITGEDNVIDSSLDQTDVNLTENDTSVGSVEAFTITFNATNWVQAKETNNAGTGDADAKKKALVWHFKDTPVGLDIDANSVTVTVNAGTDGEQDITATITNKAVNASTGILTFDIPWVNADEEFLYETQTAGSALIPVTVTYTATVTAAAATAPAPNTVEVKYDRDDEQDVELGDDTTTTYTYKFLLKKVDENSAALDGAEFQLFYGDQEAPLTFTMVDGKYRYDPEGTVTNIAPTGDDASAEVIGLDNATYTLKEVVVPAGYNKAEDKEVSGLVKEDGQSEASATTITVENNKGTVLPSTGGIGTTIFYVVGSILVVAAGVLLITKKRMSREG